MKTDKKLKKLIEKQGDAIKDKNQAFYQRMLSSYPSDQESKPSFFEWFTPKRLSAISARLVLVLVLTVSLGLGLNGKRHQGGGTIEVSLPEYAQIVPSVSYENFQIEGLVETRATETLEFGDFAVAIEDSAEVYVYSEGGSVVHFITDTCENGFYRVQVVKGQGYEYLSRLTDKTQNYNINGCEFVCSTLYAEDDKVVCFFAETMLPNGDVLAVDFITKTFECEKAFIDLLNNLIG